jgi:hypothetical protein
MITLRDVFQAKHGRYDQALNSSRDQHAGWMNMWYELFTWYRFQTNVHSLVCISGNQGYKKSVNIRQQDDIWTKSYFNREYRILKLISSES